MDTHETTLEFEYDQPSRARIVAESVTREIGEIDDERSQTTIEREGAVVTVRIGAADVIALRAAVNTWLSLLDVAEQTAAIGVAAVEDDSSH
ncbi:KEOPS complex subunit Pcc1 [Natrialba magadii ATCC 43099]|uniref:KEOPS complex Pcc1-like subunit n=1 Tax=Natrialba magadii (strain ATCC 43099 / DSM 3394 / CCM 3739 / CIP 104546 / IAM 13178 / JCM 8861 / NBRC 102185 / NCIMB 2190 / MS3) TaxID=547559 RepID=D3SXR2_NATMM|nr:KEOPS complex subunit Pcc1 [Natrialba magadii]ADD06011.1 KEOPS complex subunit Pcc1 [Natrialba magadii ATCC 43099]ELY30480.1 KEOPS complex Pcc1-like subunit [Natrialba magadii ATCC 43099]